MLLIIFMLILAVAAAVVPRLLPEQFIGFARPVRFALGFLAIFIGASTSWVHVSPNEVGHMKRIYGSSLTEGRIIATDGEAGYQADVLAPGFHFRPFLNVIYDVETLPAVQIPAGVYGRLEAMDGKPLPDGAVLAPAWNPGDAARMLDANYFLTGNVSGEIGEEGRNGPGYRGVQTDVLSPGTYYLNLYLFRVVAYQHDSGSTQIYDRNGQTTSPHQIDTTLTRVPTGSVAVVKSNIQEPGKDCTPVTRAAVEGSVAVPLVPKGCRGIWAEALPPQDYYLNRDAYQVTLVETRAQTWEYKGGYKKRFLDLKVDQQGKIETTERSFDEPVEKSYADRALMLKVEGWDVPQELRVLVQVKPENAPLVVASVGGLPEVEDRILTPTVRSIVRNVAGSTIWMPTPELDGAAAEDLPRLVQEQYTKTTRFRRDADGKTYIQRPTRVLDLIENRAVLEANVEEQLRAEGRKAGVDIMEVRFGEPAIPPELLVARQREQLSQQLAKAYQQEELAQKERQKTEAARATADQQQTLVTSQIGVQVADLEIEKQTKMGQAQRAYLENLAAGQKAQAQVLGEDKVYQMNVVNSVLELLKEKPELLSHVGKLVPNTVVTTGASGGGGLEGAAAVFGSFMGDPDKKAAR